MEIGKFYKNEGEMLFLSTFLRTKAFGPTYIAEYINTRAERIHTVGVKIIPIDIRDDKFKDWVEIKEKEFISKINLEIK